MIEKLMTPESPYFKSKFPNHKSIKEKVLSEIEIMPEKNLDIPGNSFITKLDWNIDRNYERKYLKYIENNLIEYMTNFIKETKWNTWTIHNVWFQQYIHNSNHNWHVHTQCQFTNVYYLELPKDAPQTDIINPFTNECQTLDVEEGDVITFPSFIIHRAPIIENDTRKTIISFNSDLDLDDSLYNV